MSHSASTKILSQLKQLSKQALNNPSNKLTVQSLLEKAFKNGKPLFSSHDRSEAATFVTNIIPVLDSVFVDIHGSMNTDLRQSAQIWRSGLQFLVDEFKTDEILYQKLKDFLTSDPVQCVEQYISDSRDSLPEYGDIAHMDLTKIPKEHYWWF
ncbi:unnamed protein product [Adineta ricciae]|nr:unnamed protein product [Adineta ricciae]